MALDKLAPYNEQIAIEAIKNAISGNYQGIFPESVKQITTGNKINQKSNGANMDRLAELATRILSGPQSGITG
jgi:hypothetical protein